MKPMIFRLLLLLGGVSFLCFHAECAASTSDSHAQIVQKVTLGHGLGWAIGNTKRRYVALKTTDGGRHWKDVGLLGFWPRRTPTQVSGIDEEPGLGEDAGVSSTSPSQGGFAVVEDDEDKGAAAVRVASTTTAGRKWTLTRFRVPEWVESISFQFVDARHGFLLALSGPSAGLMEKQVYQTSDGSRTWHLVSNGVASNANFYPTGMVFRTPSNGWITATYHGAPDVPIFRTDNGGKTWHPQSLPEPAVYKNGGYGNTNPPQFFGPQKRSGALRVDYRNWHIHQFETIVYVTHNGGGTWRISKRKRLKE